MTDQLKAEIFILNLKYHDMRIAEMSVREYDYNHNDKDSQDIRRLLIKVLENKGKLYDEQNDKIEKIINEL